MGLWACGNAAASLEQRSIFLLNLLKGEHGETKFTHEKGVLGQHIRRGFFRKVHPVCGYQLTMNIVSSHRQTLIHLSSDRMNQFDAGSGRFAKTHFSHIHTRKRKGRICLVWNNSCERRPSSRVGLLVNGSRHVCMCLI